MISANKPFLSSKFKPGMMTIHETGELIRRRALEAGLFPILEYKIKKSTNPSGFAYVDWVLLDSQRNPVVAIEIDATNVQKSYVEQSFENLRCCDAPVKIQILYQIRRFEVLGTSKWVSKHSAQDIRVLNDEEFWLDKLLFHRLF
ncbi:hypothetical protein OCL06_08615 [Alteromonas sp. ASW11-19]|uniref:DUF2726 domain-containing protein n=1 Tax=Alteromonas salexigens TaxID=2982530 RepID=A0ABT2VMX4_9ALTE|nr:hypothetical protein [Alteromonas salexigens]MCU7554660.1 hypothetical protein [Alteromonas salexigens]